MSTKRRLSALAMAVAGVLGVHSANADVFTWQGVTDDTTNPGNGPWSIASYWTTNTGPNRFPASNPDFDDYANRASNEIIFGGSDLHGPYTAWHDLEPHGLPVELNILRFRSTGSAANTISQVDPDSGFLSNGRLRFVNNGSTAPRLIQDGSGAFNIDVPIEFSVNTAFTGAGTGRINLLNTLTGTGSLEIQGGNTFVAGNARVTTASAINFGAAGGGGSLTLDNSASVQDRLADNIAITFGDGGGTLGYVGNAAASTETVGNVTVNGGANRLQVTSTGGGAATLNVTNFSRTGGLVDFAGVGGTLGGGASGPRITFATAPTLVNGLIGGWATANGTDFATYGANGVTAYTAYTALPASNFSATTNYQATGNVTLTGGGDIFTLKLNAPSNQTIDLGANSLNVTGGILKVGAGTTTINGTGNFGGGSASELILTVSQGTLNLNAPFGAQNWTKAGSGGLNLQLAGSPVWQTASFSGPLGLNVTADSTISGNLVGGGSIVKTGNGKLTLTSPNNSYAGGTTINAGTVELLASGSSPNVNLTGGGNYLSTTGPLTINGGTLKVTTSTGPTTAGNIQLTKAITFGANGGLLDLTNLVGGTLGGGSSTNIAGFSGVSVGGGNSNFGLTTSSNANAAPAVIRFNGGAAGFSDPTNFANWNAGGNVLRINSYSGNGPVRIELEKAGTYRQGNGGGNTVTIPMAIAIAGPSVAAGGDPTSGLNGTISPSTTTNTGHVATDNFATLVYSQGLNLEGALQMSVQGASRQIGGNITLKGLASGNPAYVAFNGRGTGTALSDNINDPGESATGQNPLYVGRAGTADTLTIEDGAIARMDTRIRTDQSRSSGAFLEAATVINAGGTLQFAQSTTSGSTAATGYDRVNNTITAQGSTARESNIDLYLGAADTASNGAKINGVLFNGTAVALTVSGSGLGGLRVNGLNLPSGVLNGATDTASNLKVSNLLTPERLAGLTGSGGYLTPAAQGATFTLPAGGEWASNVSVGLRATNSNAGGTDVALPTGSTWSHNLHVDAGAALGVDNVTVAGGTTSGLGTLAAGSGGVRFGSGTTLKPGIAGATAGTLSVTGNLALNGGSTFAVEINGTASSVKGTGNVSVTGAALQIVQTAVPATGGQRWEILVADSDADSVGALSGKLTATLPGDDASGRRWSLAYLPTKLVMGLTLPGDGNYDGRVNFSDLAILAQNYNKSGQWNQGDFNANGGDGRVNFSDLAILAQNYNKSLPAPTEVAGASAEFNADLAAAFAAVPEPGSLGLVGLGLAALTGGRRRRRRQA